MIRIASAFCLALLAGTTLAVDQATVSVQSLVPGSPAEAAGIREGDILLEYGGQPVGSVADVQRLRAEVEADSVDITLLRDGEQVVVRLPAGQMGVYLKEILPALEYKPDAVVIDDVPALGWDSGKENSFLACVEAVADYLGVDQDYTGLYGASGAAFRLHFHKDWCPSSPDPTCGYPTGDRALDALLMVNHEFQHAEQNDTAAQAALRAAIIASIAREMPVIAIDLRTMPEWGLVTGHQDGGNELICRTYFDRREGYDLAEKFPWAACLLDTRPVAMPEPDIRTVAAIAVENLETERYDDYYSGFAAFDYWLERLGDPELDTVGLDRLQEIGQANAWIYSRLIHDRLQAVDYLKRIAGESPDQAERLNALAEVYGAETELLGIADEAVLCAAGIKDQAGWPAEMRAEQVRRLTAARAKEKDALALWQGILGPTSNEGE